MPNFNLTLAIVLSAIPLAAVADPSLECSIHPGSQIEIGNCVAEAETAVDKTVELALGFAMNAAKEIGKVTGRKVSEAALVQGHYAWSGYRDAHCNYVGSTFGGGSGTGITVRSCRVELGRVRVTELMNYAQ